MEITRQALGDIFTGFKANFNSGFEGAESAYGDIAMTVPSSHKSEIYGWLGQVPKLREWIGDRVIKKLSSHSFSVTNKLFEDTISVQRTDIEDDNIGIYAPLFTDMGRAAKEKPDELVFALLAQGFTSLCYDGQNFFDADHPVTNSDGETVTVSNMQAGNGPAWYLLDTSRAVRPLIYQERIAPKLTKLDNDEDQNVFFRDEYIYGVRARSNAGFGLWQLAFGSKAELNAENYEAARQQMMKLKGDEGRLLGIKPNVLVTSPELEGAAMRLLNNGTRVVTVDNGGTPAVVSVQNEWAGTAKPIVTAWATAA
ncbi:Mu-like prophage major head subunit gpT family protein [Brucella anthropi]|uniref:Mu-like prophage major head subunit gpT family protein n=1 Tax=Brucella anthropi TaxID=529 RepID=UPI000F68D47C|nr:Mu-like prophage major head subunit gpT family protein [Brucella anthropi]RRY11499.1 head protein [Brucella anthropi]